MPAHCVVVGCKSIGGKRAKEKVRFFRLPGFNTHQVHKPLLQELSTTRRKKWLAATHRNDLTETKLKYMRFCEKHFISGEPANIYDKDSPDWVPSVNMGYKTSLPNAEHRLKRHERATARRQKLMQQEESARNNKEAQTTTSTNKIITNTVELVKRYPMLHEQLHPVDVIIEDETNIVNLVQSNPREISKPAIEKFKVIRIEPSRKTIPPEPAKLKQDTATPIVQYQYSVQLQSDEGSSSNDLTMPEVFIPISHPSPADWDKFGDFVAAKLKVYKTEYCKTRVQDVITKYLSRMEEYDERLNAELQECMQPASKMELDEHSYAMHY